ncbi:unnamed protein product [Commensalibacter communis]|uniref:hypothetical protein n=1 Tax=Commensalibacter communis TaxID=2972786 RepID=UPI0022FF9EA7|nr:hypothetical protein [Commensalibacter communis]CAI3954279.1 unnamed protein product [Commensalibacter communis]
MKKITFPILIITALFGFTQPGFTQNSVNLKEMQEPADQSNVEAQYNMGVIYDRGINMPKKWVKSCGILF